MPSERLSDEELANMEATYSTLEHGDPRVLDALAEIRSHRAARLTDEEAAALVAYAQDGIDAAPPCETELRKRALAALDKLLGNGGGR